MGILASTLVLAASVSGCGLLGDEQADSGGSSGPLEKSTITVSTLPAIDVAPLHMAVQRGYFKELGLTVKIDKAASGQASFTKLVSQQADISFSSYVPFFVAQSKGAANIKFVADGVSTNPNTFVLVTMPDSGVTSIKDLEGKKVGVSALNTISDTIVKSVMKTHDADFESVQFTPISFPDIPGAVERGDIAAGLLIEPFLTQAAKTVGTVPLADVATGPTNDFPLAGYGALATFAEENPKTVEAFQKGMQRAVEESQDRTLVEQTLLDYTKIDEATAKLVALPNFQATLDAKRLQRVPDLMREFGVIESAVDASQMIAKPSET